MFNWFSDSRDSYHSLAIVKTINEALRLRQEYNAFTFFIRSTAQLDEPDVLRDLVAQNQDFLAPLLETYAHDQIWYTWEQAQDYYNEKKKKCKLLLKFIIALLQIFFLLFRL